MKYQYFRGRQTGFSCLKATHIFLRVIIVVTTSAQAPYANTSPQGMQSENKGISDTHIKGCPARLLGDSHNSPNKGIPDKDAEARCSRRQLPYNIPNNLAAPHELAASLEQNSCQILIFFSFSMPEISLKNLAQEAARDQGNSCRPVLVMRGLYQDSFAKTAEKLKNLSVSVDINPELFDVHQVTAVPTFVFVEGGKPLLRLKGNVTLEFAKESFGFRDQAPGLMHASAAPEKQHKRSQ